jgi:hypothetical protein
MPEQPAPLQPLNLSLLVAGTAVKVTIVFSLKAAEQVEPQLIPAGLLEIVPLPVPDLETLRMYVLRVNVAVTDLAASIRTRQVLVPEHSSPLQPVKDDPVAGVAVRTTVIS